MTTAPSAPGGPHRRWPTRVARRVARTWRVWLPAVLLALLSVTVTQELDAWALRGLPDLPARLLADALETIVVLIPMVLYILWHRNAARYRSAYQKLQAAEALRQDLVNMLVHDLKNPTITAGMAVSLLDPENGGADLTEERRGELVRAASRGLLRLERMIGDILQVARAEAGQMPLRLEPVDVRNIARQAAEEAAVYLKEASLELRQDYTDEPLVALVDPDTVQRAVDNLLMNACKFTPPDGCVEISVTRQGESVQVAVSDTGQGIPAGEQSRVFDKFGQATVRSGKGRSAVGLGLTFTRLAVEAHGGRIWVESEPGQGATFTFTLPMQLPRPAETADC